MNNNYNDNLYIYNLLSKENISPLKLDQYLIKLCKIIFTDLINLKITSDHFSICDFTIDLTLKTDRQEFESLIKTYVYQQVAFKGIEFLKDKKSKNFKSHKILKVEEFITKFDSSKNMDCKLNLKQNLSILETNNSEDFKSSNLISENFEKKIKKVEKHIFLNKKIPKSSTTPVIMSNSDITKNNITNKTNEPAPIQDAIDIILKQNKIINNLLGYYNSHNNSSNNSNNLILYYPQYAN